MTYQAPGSFGFEGTPNAVRALIIATCAISIASAFIDPFIGAYGPQFLLSLSWAGLAHFFLWQPLSYLFVLPAFSGITLSFFISLLFNMYILWFVGSSLVANFGTKSFLKLYLGSGIIGGLITLFVAALIGQNGFLAGPTASIFAILAAWTMLYPDMELLFFFLFPAKAKWIFAGFVAVIGLISLSQSDFMTLTSMLAGILCGYLFTVKKPASDGVENKIVNIKTGKPVKSDETNDDEAFVDAMLEKIGKQGESSLTARERARMDKISKAKRK